MVGFSGKFRLLALVAVVLSLSCGEQVVVRETQAACGNGQIDGEEQCDDGNTLNEDAALRRALWRFAAMA